MEVRLATEQKSFIHKQVRTGRFPTPEAVVVEALRRMEEEDIAKLARLREEIGIGIEAADRGDFVPLNVEEIVGEILAENA